MGTKINSIYNSLIAEGEAKGEVKGKAMGKAELLIKQLEAKFPDISETDKEKVLKLETEEFEKLAIEFLSIESLEELKQLFS